MCNSEPGKTVLTAHSALGTLTVHRALFLTIPETPAVLKSIFLRLFLKPVHGRKTLLERTTLKTRPGANVSSCASH